jgi:hypothetical protein
MRAPSKLSSSLLGLVALALLAVGASGCKDFRYFDVHVTFDAATFDIVSVGSLDHCSLTVSGADNLSDQLLPGCPNKDPKATDRLDAGTFEFSTLSDSGNLKFDVKAWLSNNENPACLLGEGSVTLPVTSALTTNGNLVVAKTGDGTGCMN